MPFLVLAFLILYFSPQSSARRFAWSIQPDMTAMFMGAGYIGGAWLFANTIFGRRWHRVAPGFPAVTAFAATMLLATIVHWDRFDLRHFPFLLWLGLYGATPFLVLYVWLHNRATDPGTAEDSDASVPGIARWSLLALGVLLLASALTGFANPSWLIDAWQWKLTPLTARVMSGWFALLGVGGIVISTDSRWSAWKVGLQSIGLWQLLVLVAAYSNADEFRVGPVNWYTLSVFVVLAGMLVLYGVMERTRHSRSASAG